MCGVLLIEHVRMNDPFRRDGIKRSRRRRLTFPHHHSVAQLQVLLGPPDVAERNR